MQKILADAMPLGLLEQQNPIPIRIISYHYLDEYIKKGIGSELYAKEKNKIFTGGA